LSGASRASPYRGGWPAVFEKSLDKLLALEDDERAVELARLKDGEAGEPWLLIQSVVNEDAKALPPEAWRA
jgi:hypothetical protein